MSVIFAGWVALGTSYNISTGALTELSGGSYARQAVNLVGSFLTGASQSLSAFGICAATPDPLAIRSGAILDAATGGNLLCHWGWGAPRTANTVAFPATTLNLTLAHSIAASAAVSAAPLSAGSQIGWMNGNPLMAGCILVLNGGVFVASGASLLTQSVSSPGALSSTLPATSGVLWNNGGVLSIS